MKADEKKVLTLLKTAKGQMEGIIKMVESDRYCIDISNQLLACQAIIRNVNNEILNAHLKNCVKNAMADTKDGEQVIDEMVMLIDKLSK